MAWAGGNRVPEFPCRGRAGHAGVADGNVSRGVWRPPPPAGIGSRVKSPAASRLPDRPLPFAVVRRAVVVLVLVAMAAWLVSLYEYAHVPRPVFPHPPAFLHAGRFTPWPFPAATDVRS